MMLIVLFDILGTVAFAFSGALIGMQKKLDLFGVVFLGITTAVGGGIFRDIILGSFPPTAFVKPTYCILSIAVSLIAFYGYPVLSKRHSKNVKKDFENSGEHSRYMTSEQLIRVASKRKQMVILKNVISIFDAIGLAAFTITGANLAINHPKSNIFLVVCMGLITGVGGGVLRDTMVQSTPIIFTKEIYAVASIIGGIVFYFCSICSVSYNIAYCICFVLIFLSRMLSIKYNINLPSYNSDKYKIYM